MSAKTHLALGDRSLDRDHHQIFDYICEVQDLLITGRKQALIGALLGRLERCSLLHFAAEEGMMNSTRYPELPRHLLNHMRMTEHLEALLALYDRGELTLLRRAMTVLSDSHLRHVGGDDFNYAIWLDLPREIPRRLL